MPLRNALQVALPEKGTASVHLLLQDRARPARKGGGMGTPTEAPRYATMRQVTAALHLTDRSRTKAAGKVYLKRPTDLQSRVLCPGSIYHAPNESFAATEGIATGWTPSAISANTE